MEVKTAEEIKTYIEKLFPSAEISVKERTYAGQDCINIKITKMYEYVELGFATLMKVAKFCKTQEIDVDEWSYGGCPTCDWGSSYTKELQIMNLGSWDGNLEND